jgi:hypothetical protein
MKKLQNEHAENILEIKIKYVNSAAMKCGRTIILVSGYFICKLK